MQVIQTSGNRAVQIIDKGDGWVSAYLIINARKGIDHPNAQVVLSWGGSTMAGANRWAAKMLAV